MKKSFLLLLLHLFALISWAQPSGVATAPTLVSSPITWDGYEHPLIATAGATVTGYVSSYNPSSYWSGAGWNQYEDDPAGIQFYVRTGLILPQ